MKKLFIAILFGLAFRELHRDMSKRQKFWNRSSVQIIQLPLDPKEFVKIIEII